MTTATKYKTYPKYKPSGIDWLGDIPADWEVKRLKYGFYFTKGKNAALYTAEYNAEHAGDYPVYSGQTEGEGVMGSIDSYDYDFEKVIFTTTVGAKVMTPLLLSGKFSLSQNCLLMIKSSKQVDEKYFYYQLFPLFDREKSLVPSHMQPSLRFSDLNTFDVAYPEINEQQEIVAFLDRETAKIDEMVAKKQKMIDLLKEKRQALITHAVTNGLDSKAKMKSSGIDWLGDIPDNWEAKRFGFLFSFNKGLSITKENLQDEGIPCVNYGEIHSKYGFEVDPLKNELRCVSNSYLENNQGSILQYGNFVFADTSEDVEGAGNFTYLNSHELAFAGYHTIITRPKVKINFRFIAYLFDSVSFRTQIRSAVSGIKVYSITKNILKNCYVLLPPSLVQQSIADFLDRETAKIDEMIKKVEMQIEKLHEYRQALITGAVTGKIKIN